MDMVDNMRAIPQPGGAGLGDPFRVAQPIGTGGFIGAGAAPNTGAYGVAANAGSLPEALGGTAGVPSQQSQNGINTLLGAGPASNPGGPSIPAFYGR